MSTTPANVTLELFAGSDPILHLPSTAPNHRHLANALEALAGGSYATTIVLKTDQPVHIRTLEVSLTVFERIRKYARTKRTEKCEGCNGKPEIPTKTCSCMSSSPSVTKTVPGKRKMKEKLVELKRFSQPIWTEPRRLVAGSYENSFTFFVPAGIPPTHVVGSGRPGREIIHVLAVHARTMIDEERTVSVERQIQVHACGPRMPSAVGEKAKMMNMSVKTVSLSDLFIAVKFPNSVFLQDRKFRASVSISPSRDKGDVIIIRSYDVHLVEIVTKSSTKDNGRSKVLSSATLDGLRAKSDIATPSHEETAEVLLPIPPHSRPDLIIPSFANVSHALRIVARYVATTAPNVPLESHAEFPITVACAPSSNGWKTWKRCPWGGCWEANDGMVDEDGEDADARSESRSVASSNFSYRTTVSTTLSTTSTPLKPSKLMTSKETTLATTRTPQTIPTFVIAPPETVVIGESRTRSLSVGAAAPQPLPTASSRNPAPHSLSTGRSKSQSMSIHGGSPLARTSLRRRLPDLHQPFVISCSYWKTKPTNSTSQAQMPIPSAISPPNGVGMPAPGSMDAWNAYYVQQYYHWAYTNYQAQQQYYASIYQNQQGFPVPTGLPVPSYPSLTSSASSPPTPETSSKSTSTTPSFAAPPPLPPLAFTDDDDEEDPNVIMSPAVSVAESEDSVLTLRDGETTSSLPAIIITSDDVEEGPGTLVQDRATRRNDPKDDENDDNPTPTEPRHPTLPIDAPTITISTSPTDPVVQHKDLIYTPTEPRDTSTPSGKRTAVYVRPRAPSVLKTPVPTTRVPPMPILKNKEGGAVKRGSRELEERRGLKGVGMPLKGEEMRSSLDLVRHGL
ncbi:hypothetical protein BC829DRAFT_431243 [Chytridium lagenaria]|nr:hypothetical protein BC829DRAFT_431243 [Chytridium lagenaria]